MVNFNDKHRRELKKFDMLNLMESLVRQKRFTEASEIYLEYFAEGCHAKLRARCDAVEDALYYWINKGMEILTENVSLIESLLAQKQRASYLQALALFRQHFSVEFPHCLYERLVVIEKKLKAFMARGGIADDSSANKNPKVVKKTQDPRRLGTGSVAKTPMKPGSFRTRVGNNIHVNGPKLTATAELCQLEDAPSTPRDARISAVRISLTHPLAPLRSEVRLDERKPEDEVLYGDVVSDIKENHVIPELNRAFPNGSKKVRFADKPEVQEYFPSRTPSSVLPCREIRMKLSKISTQMNRSS